jgi:DNA primase
MTPEVNTQFVEAYLDVQGRQGREYSVCCPFHGEQHASMRINVDKGVYFCHGCKAKGGMVRLARHLGVSYKYDKAEAGMVKLRSKLDLLRKGAQTEEELVLPEDTLKRYLSGGTRYWTDPRPRGRGLSEETVEAFELGFDPMTDSATIPIRNMWGELLGITRRYLGHEGNRPKYKDPKGFQKRKNLFGSWFVAQAESPTVVLTEGPLDAIKVWQAGHPAVAVYGSYLSEHQIMLLRRLGVITCVLMFDNDTAGIEAMKWAKGFTKDNDGKWHYNPATDLRKFFVLKRASYSGLRGNDPGDMSDSDIDKAVLSAKLLLR